MTAPDPAVVGVPAEAVEAAAPRWRPSVPGVTAEALNAGITALMADKYARRYVGSPGYAANVVQLALAAALPHLCAQVLAEVQEALRDKQRFDAWFALPTDQRTLAPDDQTWPECCADYLRDTLTGKAAPLPPASNEMREHPGHGVPMEGVEVPADGTWRTLAGEAEEGT